MTGTVLDWPDLVYSNTSRRHAEPARLLRDVHQLIPAATGRWSLPVVGSTQELRGSTPLTRIWSIRATGNFAGQLKPKPFPAASWAERSCEVMSANARSSMVPFRSP